MRLSVGTCIQLPATKGEKHKFHAMLPQCNTLDLLAISNLYSPNSMNPHCTPARPRDPPSLSHPPVPSPNFTQTHSPITAVDPHPTNQQIRSSPSLPVQTLDLYHIHAVSHRHNLYRPCASAPTCTYHHERAITISTIVNN
ncbi:unnamed protein product [Periconia digitata]|uniref:Uncharacterized protein n=1 Tax=Periconia digitata TaxID=1303443 RepID=A0A9W4XR27_9PLEO|nr:unnamed protein product [Periconia digitata]